VHRRSSWQAPVRINGRDIYCGRFGTPEAEETYRRIVAEHLPAGGTPAAVQPLGRDDSAGLLIVELMLAYNVHCEAWYVKNDKPTIELGLTKDSLRRLRLLYGSTPANEFTPMKLEAVGDEMLRVGLVRSSINRRLGRLK
jgi:hypothetical protein